VSAWNSNRSANAAETSARETGVSARAARQTADLKEAKNKQQHRLHLSSNQSGSSGNSGSRFGGAPSVNGSTTAVLPLPTSSPSSHISAFASTTSGESATSAASSVATSQSRSKAVSLTFQQRFQLLDLQALLELSCQGGDDGFGDDSDRSFDSPPSFLDPDESTHTAPSISVTTISLAKSRNELEDRLDAALHDLIQRHQAGSSLARRT
jgi:hypothetical protein